MKAVLALEVKQFVSKELTFAKLTFGKFDFLDLAKFVMINRFSILLPILLLLALLSFFDIS